MPFRSPFDGAIPMAVCLGASRALLATASGRRMFPATPDVCPCSSGLYLDLDPDVNRITEALDEAALALPRTIRTALRRRQFSAVFATGPRARPALPACLIVSDRSCGQRNARSHAHPTIDWGPVKVHILAWMVECGFGPV